uniref:Rhoptry-associated protein, putative n=1 Tax=Theileria annulata TaxID=5874 RepID=A0A3B0MH22_THEAN
MGVNSLFRSFAFIYLLFNYVHGVTLKKNNGGASLDSQNTEEFVEETEKTVSEVNHLRLVSDKMTAWFAKNTYNPSMFCEGDLGTCHTLVNRYVARCKAGDCYTVDNVKVFSSGENTGLYLPHLAQYETAKYVFNNCGVRQGRWSDLGDVFKKKKGTYSLHEFTNQVLKRNLDAMNVENSTMAVVNEVFYALTVYYQRYLNNNKLNSKGQNRSRFLRFFFSLAKRRALNKLVAEVVGDKTLDLSHSDLKSMVDSYVLYLTVGNYRPRHRVANLFGKLAKQAVSKTMGYKKVSFLMADQLLDYPLDPMQFCKGNAEVGCKEVVTKFLERCDHGDCTSLDLVNLLDPKDWLNVKLPELPQAFAAFQLFTTSRAKRPNWLKALLLRQRGRMSNEEFKNMLYERNFANLTFGTKSQGLLERFLSKAAVEFVYRARGTEARKTLTNASSFLMDSMGSVVGRGRLFLEVARVRAMMLEFRNYLYKSGTDVPLKKVNAFASVTQHVVFSFLHDEYKGVYSKEYEKEWEKKVEKEMKKKEKGGFSKFTDKVKNLFGKVRGEKQKEPEQEEFNEKGEDLELKLAEQKLEEAGTQL